MPLISVIYRVLICVKCHSFVLAFLLICKKLCLFEKGCHCHWYICRAFDRINFSFYAKEDDFKCHLLWHLCVASDRCKLLFFTMLTLTKCNFLWHLIFTNCLFEEK